jgi:HD superfamily phosphohydrolase
MLPAALLHDIGKPAVAYQKPEDIPTGEYSFTDHEEASYRIIEKWPFVSDYTKELVRYHYLIRDIDKHRTKDPARAKEKSEIWDSLSSQTQSDLQRFLRYDDLGKGIEETGTKGAAK